ncbi:hypothetical protein [Janibacter sp. LM]|uniref:hypothetical protein n=1 Tax=Janibacter sp. LM TaxID=3144845 RepID=UPI0031F7085E
MTGVLTAGRATGQLLVLPPVASIPDNIGWRPASLFCGKSPLEFVENHVQSHLELSREGVVPGTGQLADEFGEVWVLVPRNTDLISVIRLS